MNELSSGFVVAFISFVFGALITRWWDRARPIITIQGFTTTSKVVEEAEVSNELSGLTENSFFIQRLRAGNTTMNNIVNAHRIAQVFIARSRNAPTELHESIEILSRSTDETTTLMGLKRAIVSRAISDVLETALLCSRIKLPDPRNYAQKPPLKITLSEKDDGCYLILWEAATSTFGSDFKNNPWKKDLIHPIIPFLQQLDRDSILEIFRKLEPILKDQIELHNRLIQTCKPVVEQSVRWAGKVIVSNYGAAPMILWPDARLLFIHDSSGSKIPAEGYVAIHDAEGKTHDLVGLRAIAPGEILQLLVLTKQTRHEMREKGELIFAHYVNKDADACITLKITRRGTLPFWATKTSRARFYESTGIEI